MITCWDKTGKIIHTDINDDDFQMWEADTSVFGIRKSNKFPEDGFILTSNGNYRQKTKQEQINDGTLSLNSYKEDAYIRITNEANLFLTTARTKSGHLVNNDAQKIALFTISMKNVDNNDIDKILYSTSGLIYDIDKAREILSYCADVKTVVQACNLAIKTANLVVSIDAIKFQV